MGVLNSLLEKGVQPYENWNTKDNKKFKGHEHVLTMSSYNQEVFLEDITLESIYPLVFFDQNQDRDTYAEIVSGHVGDNVFAINYKGTKFLRGQKTWGRLNFLVDGTIEIFNIWRRGDEVNGIRRYFTFATYTLLGHPENLLTKDWNNTEGIPQKTVTNLTDEETVSHPNLRKYIWDNNEIIVIPVDDEHPDITVDPDNPPSENNPSLPTEEDTGGGETIDFIPEY